LQSIELESNGEKERVLVLDGAVSFVKGEIDWNDFLFSFKDILNDEKECFAIGVYADSGKSIVIFDNKQAIGAYCSGEISDTLEEDIDSGLHSFANFALGDEKGLLEKAIVDINDGEYLIVSYYGKKEALER